MPESFAEALHLPIDEVNLGLGPRGFARKFLEDKAWALEKEGKWLPFIAILALLIYGVVMFPNDDDYINHSIISVFMSGNTIPALVSDVYYCLHTRHEKKRVWYWVVLHYYIGSYPTCLIRALGGLLERLEVVPKVFFPYRRSFGLVPFYLQHRTSYHGLWGLPECATHGSTRLHQLQPFVGSEAFGIPDEEWT